MNTEFINVITKEEILPTCIGNTQNVTWENSRELLKSIGWRIRPELPAPEDGFERVRLSYLNNNGEDLAQAEYVDILIQDRLDEEAEIRKEEFVNSGLCMKASLFRNLLVSFFGEGAEVNRQITEAYVTQYMLSVTGLSGDRVRDGIFMQKLFEELSAWNNGETWTLFEKYGDIIA